MLNGQIRKISEISSQEVHQMFLLMNEFYEHMQEQVFLNDFYDKDYCLTLEHETDGLVGFTTQKLLDVVVNGEVVHGMFSGDTIIHKQYWGSFELFRVWAQFWFEYAQKYPAFYWFLICKGYKTYRIMPLFWEQYYPCYKEETPEYEQEIMDAYATLLFSEEYNKATGVIEYHKIKDRLKEGVADITQSQLKNKEISYFCEKNPNHAGGNDLVCLAKIDKSLLKKRLLGALFE